MTNLQGAPFIRSTGTIEIVRTLAQYDALQGSYAPATSPCDFSTQMIVLIGVTVDACVGERVSWGTVCYAPDSVVLTLDDAYPKIPPSAICQSIISMTFGAVVDKTSLPVSIHWIYSFY